MLISFGSGNWSGTIPILRQEQFCRGEPFHDTSSAYVWRVTGVRTYLFQSVTRWAWLSWMKFQWLHLLSNSKQTLILENRIRKLYWHGQLTCLKRAENKTLETILRLLCRHLISGGSCNTSASRERSFLSIRKSTLESAYRPQNGGRIDVKTWYRS